MPVSRVFGLLVVENKACCFPQGQKMAGRRGTVTVTKGRAQPALMLKVRDWLIAKGQN